MVGFSGDGFSGHHIRRRSVPLLAIAAAGLLASCANPAAEYAVAAQGSLAGMPKETLLSCAGVPDRQATAGNMEYFTYHSGRLVTYPGSGYGFYGGGWGPHYGYGMGWPAYGPEVTSVDCEATFTLRNGVVERLIYGGGTQMSQCYSIVRNCLAMTSPPPVR